MSYLLPNAADWQNLALASPPTEWTGTRYEPPGDAAFGMRYLPAALAGDRLAGELVNFAGAYSLFVSVAGVEYAELSLSQQVFEIVLPAVDAGDLELFIGAAGDFAGGAVAFPAAFVYLQPSPLEANPDSATVGGPGVAILDVAANDTYNGLPVPGDRELSVEGILPPELDFDTESGQVTVLTSTPGVYTFTYRLAYRPSLEDPDWQVTATVTVTLAGEGCEPVANDDDATVTAPGLAIADVRANDTGCDDGALTVVGLVPAELDFDTTTGAVTLLPGASPGVYSFLYLLEGTAQAQVTVEYEPPPNVCYPPVCSCTLPAC